MKRPTNSKPPITSTDSILKGIARGEKAIMEGKVYTHSQAKKNLKNGLNLDVLGIAAQPTVTINNRYIQRNTMNNHWLYETTLKGKLVTLAPLQREHADALVEAASNGELWNLWYTSVPNNETIDTYLDQAYKDQVDGQALAFAVIDNATQKIIGTTRYCNADTLNQRIEIGYTWYAKSFQRSGVNTECKYLLLKHAFETLNAIAVEFRTHWHNEASRAAIARLGAKQDGILRNHQKNAAGIYRDTVVFSIIDQEWPAVKKNLQYKITYPSKH